jgi:hypothetical protein
MPDETDGLSPDSERHLFLLTVIVAAVLVLVLAGISFAIWPRAKDGSLWWNPQAGIIIMMV